MTKPVGAGPNSLRRDRRAEPLGANSEIARKLKQYYDDLVSDDIPDRFAELLAQLEQAERPQGKD
ncbi:NepR family anti-sigma factor [Arvimicrobium flavum]|uniref:NepR family anti-sigma factor n=1 Tax=Arvimicrobium flavum TaxID=3393320 RepID=UPI00398CB20E